MSSLNCRSKRWVQSGLMMPSKISRIIPCWALLKKSPLMPGLVIRQLFEM
jgi:hypothetical protein